MLLVNFFFKLNFILFPLYQISPNNLIIKLKTNLILLKIKLSLYNTKDKRKKIAN